LQPQHLRTWGRELLLVNKANQINTYSFPPLKLQLKPCIVKKKPQKQNTPNYQQ
jgi:hypothetical protein